jgi:hypothetical protein
MVLSLALLFIGRYYFVGQFMKILPENRWSRGEGF